MSLKVFLRNLKFLFGYAVGEELRDCQRCLFEHSNRLLYLEMMGMENSEFAEEIRFLKSLGKTVIFPYPSCARLDHVESGLDARSQLPYVVHKGNCLYFPRTWSVRDAENTYRNFIETENILGGGYTAKAPHQYQTDTFCVNAGDVVVDVGAAEGLFSLDVAERASKLYLFESDFIWREPLRRTFAPYAEKTVIIPKWVSDRNSRNSIRLDTALAEEKGRPIFIKMDIEGSEVMVVESSKLFLMSEQSVRLACCTYHRADDARRLECLFHEMQYRTEFSSGFMLNLRRHLDPPYFRHGLIRASRNSCDFHGISFLTMPSET